MVALTTPADRLRANGHLGPYNDAPAADAEPEPVEPTSPPAEVDTAAVRAWAAEQGIELRNRGPIPAAVLEQYRTREG